MVKDPDVSIGVHDGEDAATRTAWSPAPSTPPAICCARRCRSSRPSPASTVRLLLLRHGVPDKAYGHDGVMIFADCAVNPEPDGRSSWPPSPWPRPRFRPRRRWAAWSPRWPCSPSPPRAAPSTSMVDKVVEGHAHRVKELAPDLHARRRTAGWTPRSCASVGELKAPGSPGGWPRQRAGLPGSGGGQHRLQAGAAPGAAREAYRPHPAGSLPSPCQRPVPRLLGGRYRGDRGHHRGAGAGGVRRHEQHPDCQRGFLLAEIPAHRHDRRAVPSPRATWSASASRAASSRISIAGGTFTVEQPLKDHTAAIRLVLEALTDKEHGVISSMDEIGAVGHRVLHGGEKFAGQLSHQRRSDGGHRGEHPAGPAAQPRQPAWASSACQEVMPDTPMVAVFDTAFHHDHAARKRICTPCRYDYYKRLKVRRYGFHGTSHRFVAQRTRRDLCPRKRRN